MFPENRLKVQVDKPKLISYDSGYEHSVEHWIELRILLDEEPVVEVMDVRHEDRIRFGRRAHDQSAFIAWAQRVEHKRLEDRFRSRPAYDQSAFIAWAQGIEQKRPLEFSA
ncbi:MAG: hypothetical protein CXZ00_07080 [Acidobacteria bacterium]|nr:MAG: hypothetical protein CXZ00_07080 [Acidobacteriota bacterium]